MDSVGMDTKGLKPDAYFLSDYSDKYTWTQFYILFYFYMSAYFHNLTYFLTGVESLLILNSVSTYKIRQVYILIVHIYKLAKIISEKKTMLLILSTSY